MSPEFESLLVDCESAIRRALGVTDGGQISWPRWDVGGRMPAKLIEEAIKAAYSIKNKSFPAYLPKDLKSAKNEWDEYLLRHVLGDEKCVTKASPTPNNYSAHSIAFQGPVVCSSDFCLSSLGVTSKHCSVLWVRRQTGALSRIR